MKIVINIFSCKSSTEDVDGLSGFTILHKKNGFSILIKKIICCKIGVLNKF
jgi:hypothetical protein